MTEQRTTSFPYLSVAREHGVPYGDVLRLASHLAAGGVPGDWWAHVPWRRATVLAWEAEQRRRESS
jgi:hypothetical protein